MVSKYTNGLKIEGGTVRELDLRSESEKEKARRRKIKKLLEAQGLGDEARDKRRFIKEN